MPSVELALPDLRPLPGSPAQPPLWRCLDVRPPGLPGALPMIEAGKVKPLGVSTTQRHWSLPNVPAIAEGLPGFDETLWYALMAPAGTPQDIIQMLWGEVATVLKQPDTIVSMKKMGADPSALTSKQFQAFFVEETNKWGKIIQDAGIRAD